ncbi:MAG: hypothetical protein HRU11_01140 [Parvularculaceae bacterium]|nr:hypothetical protein [Parvularculaceae bacterium]
MAIEETTKKQRHPWYLILLWVLGYVWIGFVFLSVTPLVGLFMLFTLTAHGDIGDPWTATNLVVFSAQSASYLSIPLGLGFGAIMVGRNRLSVWEMATVASGYWTNSWIVMLVLTVASGVLNKLVATRPVLSPGFIDRLTENLSSQVGYWGPDFAIPIVIGLVVHLWARRQR